MIICNLLGTVRYFSVDGRLWDEFCGLSSLIPFNGTIYGEQCNGSVSDWDDDGCVIRGNLALKSNSCRNLQPPMGNVSTSYHIHYFFR